MKENQSILEGSLFDKIFFFAIPLAISSILQQLFHAADTAVVGRFAGSEALAAVGANAPVVLLFVNALVGLAVGANVVISQNLGENNTKKIKEAIETAILLSILAGVIFAIAGLLCASFILNAISVPKEIIPLAKIYLQIYLLSLPFASLFNFGAAIIRSNGDTRRPMYCLIFAGIINLLLNLLLVIVFKMSVVGVAVATLISNVISSIMIVRILTKEEGVMRLDIRNMHIVKDPMIKMIKSGAPAALQTTVFSIANVTIQSGINYFGSDAIAGSAAANNFEMFDYYFVNAFNQAAITFVGQNYAAKNHDRCKQILKVCMIESLIGVISLEAVFYFGRYSLIRIFTTEEAVISYAMIRMICCMLPHFLMCSYEITSSVLRGMGHSMLPTLLIIIGSVGFRVFWVTIVFKVWHTFQGLLVVYPLSWVLTGIMVVTAYILTIRRDEKKRHAGNLAIFYRNPLDRGEKRW